MTTLLIALLVGMVLGEVVTLGLQWWETVQLKRMLKEVREWKNDRH